MGMHYSLPFQERPPGKAILTQLLKEGMVEDGREDWHVLLDVNPCGPVNASKVFAKRFEIRHLQPTHRVSVP
jgi:hypothetical protein